MKLNRKTIENDMRFLRQISSNVNFETDNYLDWISQIKYYCQNHSCYALAPLQIGIPKRLIYLRNTQSDMNNNENSNYDEEQVLINPIIIKAKGHTRFLEEFKATVFSHEYDHLNGILHIDLAVDVQKMTYEEKKRYGGDYPYEIISKDSEYKINKK